MRYSRPTVYTYVPNFVRIGLLCRPRAAKKNNFCHFCISAFSGVAIWQQSEKVEQGCTTTTLPLSNASKSFLYSNAFMAKSSEQSVTFKSATNRHVFGRLGGGSGDIRGPSPTKLGMVIEHLEHVVAPQKLLGSDA